MFVTYFVLSLLFWIKCNFCFILGTKKLNFTNGYTMPYKCKMLSYTGDSNNNINLVNSNDFLLLSH